MVPESGDIQVLLRSYTMSSRVRSVLLTIICTSTVPRPWPMHKVTLLAKTAREKGAKAMTGMAMLVLQAVAAHEIWDNASYKTEDINKIISDMEDLI